MVQAMARINQVSSMCNSPNGVSVSKVRSRLERRSGSGPIGQLIRGHPLCGPVQRQADQALRGQYILRPRDCPPRASHFLP